MHSSIKTLVGGVLCAALFLGISFMPVPCQAGFVPTLKLEQQSGTNTKAEVRAGHAQSGKEQQTYGDAGSAVQPADAHTSARG